VSDTGSRYDVRGGSRISRYIDVHARAAPCLGHVGGGKKSGSEWAGMAVCPAGSGSATVPEGFRKQRALERSQRLHTLAGLLPDPVWVIVSTLRLCSDARYISNFTFAPPSLATVNSPWIPFLETGGYPRLPG
jgi:hypothetical protein